LSALVNEIIVSSSPKIPFLKTHVKPIQMPTMLVLETFHLFAFFTHLC